jgi:hypothetical protein
VESIEAVAIAIPAYQYAQSRETHSSHIWGLAEICTAFATESRNKPHTIE